MTRCDSCAADWSAATFSQDCAECGGGALTRACPRCGGHCGAIWQRAIVDSHDSGEAHWIGNCALTRHDESAQTARIEWWLDDSALPNLVWACLIVLSDGRAKVVDSDGAERGFADYQSASDWLREDEYDTLDELRKTGEVDAQVTPPEAWFPGSSQVG